MKDNKEVISEFNEYVNMTASELEKWLETDDSTNGAGWTNDGGDGETVGHQSGRTIVEILKANPNKNPDKYTDEQLQHMRKVASYCKRHLAQESAGNKDKDPEEVKKTKSYISLKNWGHDFLKAQQGKNGAKKSSRKDEEDEPAEDDKEDNGETEEAQEEGAEENENEGKKVGDKRKKSGQQNGSNKKRETTRKTRSADKKEDGNEDEDGDEGDEEDEENDDDQEEQEEGNGEEKEKQEDEEEEEEQEEEDEEPSKNGSKNGAKNGSKNGPHKGDTVSWNWGSGQPKGKVLDVKEEK